MLEYMFSRRFFLIWLLNVQTCSADALGNRSMPETVGWQSDPNSRGTFTLVSSCLLTLTICIYSAMYPNVPPHGESSLRYWLRSIKWALLGVFGPELVVYIAWKQYFSARTIVKRSRNHSFSQKVSSQSAEVPGSIKMEVSLDGA